MSIRTVIRKMSCQTTDLMSSGGGGYGSLSLGDVQAVISTCKTTPLIESYFYAKEGLTDNINFQNLMVFWMCHRLTQIKKGMNLAYIAKNHGNTIKASHELGHGLAQYLSRHKVGKDKMGVYFNIEKSKFSRYYAPFLRDCISDLEFELKKLTKQIDEKTNNNENI